MQNIDQQPAAPDNSGKSAGQSKSEQTKKLLIRIGVVLGILALIEIATLVYRIARPM